MIQNSPGFQVFVVLVQDVTRFPVDVKSNGRANGAFYTPTTPSDSMGDEANKTRLYSVEPYPFAQFIGKLREVDHVIGRFSSADDMNNAAEYEGQ